MYEAKESPEPETPEDQQKEAQQNSTEHQQNDTGDVAMDANNSGAAAPEVGSGSSWTKKISAWFSGVRILSRQRWPGNFVIRSTVFVQFFFTRSSLLERTFYSLTSGCAIVRRLCRGANLVFYLKLRIKTLNLL